jgi:protease-4
MSDPTPRRRWSRLGLLLLALLPVSVCGSVCVVAASSSPPVPAAVVLELDLEQAPSEVGAGGVFGSDQLSVRDIVGALQTAAADPRVVGLYARVGGSGHGLATASEVRDAIIAFRKSGKPTLAFSESFGELSPGTGGYYVATAFDEIWLQPTGMVSLAPLAAESMFARDALAKVGVEPAFAARKEFKNAANTFNEQSYTPAHREATLALLTSAQRTLVEGMVQQRSQLGDATAVTALLADGPFVDVVARDRHLVDTLGYRDEARAALLEKAKAKATASTTAPQWLWLHRYADRAGMPWDAEHAGHDATSIAVVNAIGQIHRGTSNADPLSGSQSVGSDTVAAAIRRAVADDDIKAIVLRIDSPGGSVVASDTIAHEVKRAKAAGKPVVASMGNVAGSGGYYIAMFADSIVAQPGTITGSIGVYAGKMVTTKAWEQLGINYETVAVNDADTSFFSTDMPYSEAARARLDSVVDGIYTSFVTQVAEGRHSTFDVIEPVAHGRIWSGSDAQQRHLVDVLGGWPATLAETRRLLKLTDTAPLRLQDFPGEQSPTQQVLALFGKSGDGDNSDDDGAAARAQVDVSAQLAHAAKALSSSEPVSLLISVPAVLP